MIQSGLLMSLVAYHSRIKFDGYGIALMQVKRCILKEDLIYDVICRPVSFYLDTVCSSIYRTINRVLTAIDRDHKDSVSFPVIYETDLIWRISDRHLEPCIGTFEISGRIQIALVPFEFRDGHTLIICFQKRRQSVTAWCLISAI